MFHINKTALCLTFLLLSTNAFAKVSASFSQNEIAYGEPVMLTFESDTDIQGLPDLTNIEQYFKIQGKSQSSNISVVNGVMTKKNQISYQLFPLKKGDISIGPFTLNGETIAPLTLKITDKPITNDTPDTPALPNIIFKTKILTPEIYEGEVAIYQASVIGGNLLRDAQISIPKISDLSVLTLDADKISQTIQNDVPVQNFERSFLLTPQKTGIIHIPEAQLSGAIFDPTKKRQPEFMGDFFEFPFDFNITSRMMKPVYFQSNATELTVQKKPNDYQGWWFPTKQALLTEEYIIPNNVKVGDVIERKITLKAINVQDVKLPLIEHREQDGFSLFSNQEERFSDFQNNELISIENRTFILSPQKEGKLIIPAVEIKYFNTQTKKEDIISVPEKEILVAPAPYVSIQNTINKSELESQNNTPPPPPTKKEFNTTILLICGSIFSIILSVILLIFVLKFRKKAPEKITLIEEIKKPTSKRKKKKPLPDLYLD